MKQFFLTLVLALCSLSTWAYDAYVGHVYYDLNKTTKEATVTYANTNYNSYSGDIVIPATLSYSSIKYSVTTIGENAFYKCTELKSVTIGNSVTTIPSGAFANCSSLTSVTIGNSVTSIGSEAFASCKNLETVICLAEKVPKTYTDVFKDIYVEYATLKVPEASVDLYKAAYQWKDFGNIIGIDAAGIKPITSTDSFSTIKRFENGKVIITRPDGKKFTVNGKRIE